MPAKAIAPQWEDFERKTLPPCLPLAQRDGLRSAWYAGFLAGLGSASQARCHNKFRLHTTTLLSEIECFIRNKRKRSE